jgi:hypothetical protein
MAWTCAIASQPHPTAQQTVEAASLSALFVLINPLCVAMFLCIYARSAFWAVNQHKCNNVLYHKFVRRSQGKC